MVFTECIVNIEGLDGEILNLSTTGEKEGDIRTAINELDGC